MIKLSITVQGHVSSVDRNWGPIGNTFQLECEDTALSPTEIRTLVRDWLLASTDSVKATQQVIDEIANRVNQSTGTLRTAVRVIQEG